jgi:hypothetical protein
MLDSSRKQYAAEINHARTNRITSHFYSMLLDPELRRIFRVMPSRYPSTADLSARDVKLDAICRPDYWFSGPTKKMSSSWSGEIRKVSATSRFKTMRSPAARPPKDR